jgi:hypothetical protein
MRILFGATCALASSLLLLPACSDSSLRAAREVVVQFCVHVAAGQQELARAHLVDSERHAGGRQLQQEGLRDGYEVGAARAVGAHAHVDVTSKGAAKPVTFVLERAGGTWRISLQKSMHATHGDHLEHVRKVVDQAGKQMVERFQKTLAEQAAQGQGGAPPSGNR